MRRSWRLRPSASVTTSPRPSPRATSQGSVFPVFSAFEPRRARWIARERWHRDQRAEWRADGRYVLHVPYGDPRELIMDLLRFGADVEVLAPAELRAEVAGQLAAAAARYAPA